MILCRRDGQHKMRELMGWRSSTYEAFIVLNKTNPVFSATKSR